MARTHTFTIQANTKPAEQALQRLKNRVVDVGKSAQKKVTVNGGGWGKAAFGGMIGGVTAGLMNANIAGTMSSLVTTLSAFSGFIPILRDMTSFRSGLQLASNALDLFSKGLQIAKKTQDEVSRRTNDAEQLQHRAARNGSTMENQLIAEQAWERAFGQENAQRFMEQLNSKVTDALANPSGASAESLSKLGLTAADLQQTGGDLNAQSELVLKAAVAAMQKNPGDAGTAKIINDLFGNRGATIIRQAMGTGRLANFDATKESAAAMLTARMDAFRAENPEFAGQTNEEILSSIANKNDLFAQENFRHSLNNALVTPDMIAGAVKDTQNYNAQETAMTNAILSGKYQAGKNDAQLQEDLKKFLGLDKMDFSAIGTEMKDAFSQIVDATKEAVLGISSIGGTINDIQGIFARSYDAVNNSWAFLTGGARSDKYGEWQAAQAMKAAPALAAATRDDYLAMGYRADELDATGNPIKAFSGGRLNKDYSSRPLYEVNPAAWLKKASAAAANGETVDAYGQRSGGRMDAQSAEKLSAAIASAMREETPAENAMIDLLRQMRDLAAAQGQPVATYN